MNMCPHCGFNLSADVVIERDGFTLDPRGTVHFEGKRLPLSRQQCLLLHGVATAAPRPIHRDTIWSRISDCKFEHKVAIFGELLREIRARLAAAGAPWPLSKPGRGSGLLLWEVGA